MHYADERQQHAVAMGPDDPALDRRLALSGTIDDWAPPYLQLTPGPIHDYLPNDSGLRLCSEKLRGLLEEGRAAVDSIEWLPATVSQGDMQLTYWALHFVETPDVLHRVKSVFAGPMLVKAHLDRVRVDGHRLIGFPGDVLRFGRCGQGGGRVGCLHGNEILEGPHNLAAPRYMP